MHFLRDNGLTIALMAVFVCCLVGMLWSGWLEEMAKHSCRLRPWWNTFSDRPSSRRCSRLGERIFADVGLCHLDRHIFPTRLRRVKGPRQVKSGGRGFQREASQQACTMAGEGSRPLVVDLLLRPRDRTPHPVHSIIHPSAAAQRRGSGRRFSDTWENCARALRVPLRSLAVVRMLPDLAIGISVERSARPSFDHAAPPRLVGINPSLNLIQKLAIRGAIDA